LKIDEMAKAIANGDTAIAEKKVPFIKARDVKAEMDFLKRSQNGVTKKKGDDLLRRILASLSKGRADDQKAVAETAKELVDLGWYGET
jgi:hypothetical protein